MTKRSLSFLAAATALAAFSGLHLEIASGRALEPLPPGDARLQTVKTFAATLVDRSTKTDRGEFALSSAEGRTITFQHPELPSTTVALRLWEPTAAAKGPELRTPLRDQTAPGEKKKRVVACEVLVSVLAEVASQLDAGRCVT